MRNLHAGMTATFDVSVVLATHNRPERLTRQLVALRAQTYDADRYEIVVVDDGSTPETMAVLKREQRANGRRPELRIIHREQSGGPAVARNAGWQAARAPVIAFTDDDCQAPPGWLEGGMAMAHRNPGSLVCGPILPIPEELPGFSPFHYTMHVTRCGPGFETANVFYPREVLERVGGFDEQGFPDLTTGEDVDLAWRAIESGAHPVWAPDATTHHAVTFLGPSGMLRRAWRWHGGMLAFKRHPQLRRELHFGVFWSERHLWLLRALVAALAPRRLWWLRLWLAAPYLKHLVLRRSGPLLAPWLVVHDVTEVVAIMRGALHNRVLIL